MGGVHFWDKNVKCYAWRIVALSFGVEFQMSLYVFIVFGHKLRLGGCHEWEAGVWRPSWAEENTVGTGCIWISRAICSGKHNLK